METVRRRLETFSCRSIDFVHVINDVDQSGSLKNTLIHVLPLVLVGCTVPVVIDYLAACHQHVTTGLFFCLSLLSGTGPVFHHPGSPHTSRSARTDRRTGGHCPNLFSLHFSSFLSGAHLLKLVQPQSCSDESTSPHQLLLE